MAQRIAAGILAVCASFWALEGWAAQDPAQSAAYGRDMATVDAAYPAFQRRFVDTDEGHVSYLIRPGEGVPLLLIPGSFSDALQWKETVDALPADLTLVLVELRGHGGSWPPPANGSIEQFAEDTLAIADDAAIERFYVGGHSIGGMVALEVGRQAPGRVGGIISIEGWTHHTAQKLAFGDAAAPTLTPEEVEKRAMLRARVLDHWTDAQREHFGTRWRHWDGRDFLASTDLPVLEIYGDRGRPRPDRSMLHIPDRPNITLVWLEGVSHTIPLEAPGELARLISEFVQRP